MTSALAMRPNPRHRGDPVFLKDVLPIFGVVTKFSPGWDQRGHGDFGTIQGIIVHHTGGNNTPVNIISHHPQLGLCSQIHLARDGVATLCGVGIAWHAGMGSYAGWPTNAANMVSIGIEAQSDGVSPWPQAQLDAYYRICAAILWYLGKNATTSSLLSHAEYSGNAQGKWDPGAGNGRSGVAIDMEKFRRNTQKYIDNPPFMNAVDKEEKELVSIMNEMHKSIVEGSDYAAPLKQMIVNADGHSFVARQTSEKILPLVERLLAENNNLRRDLDSQRALINRIAEKVGA